MEIFHNSGENLKKSIYFADVHQRSERISPELENGYRPEYVISTFSYSYRYK